MIPEARKEDREGLSIAEGDALISVDCDILGKVLGVMVHEYSQVEGKKLGLGGWIQSTDWNTVQGQLQGPISEVRHPQECLRPKEVSDHTPTGPASTVRKSS